MKLSDTIIVALIAGGVSLIVSLITFLATMRTIASAKEKFEKEIKEKYKDKLYQLRLEHYPKAFEITGRITPAIKRNGEGAKTHEELMLIREELRSWWVGPAAFLLSKESVKAYYGLDVTLKAASQNKAILSHGEREGIWHSVKAFRRNLKEDLDLLHGVKFDGRLNSPA